MRIDISANYEELSKKAADMVADQIIRKPNTILGLATGSTPLLMYCNIVKLHQEGCLDFQGVRTFNLDDYVGLSINDRNSYHFYMYENLFKHINIKADNICIPDGMSSDLSAECLSYEALINESGGIDLQVLGIGHNGHIGFNEPNPSFESLTHIVNLDEDTIRINSRFFDKHAQVPRQAITMGIKTIMGAGKIILLAFGCNKAEAVRKAVKGKIDPQIPASILQLHRDTVLLLDQEAAKLL